ncbi:hypothetical protein H2199_005650 [Coniosporium tulheliwenetii]|uniref:Uncharacterized protein n=1 Tax=Coniosporium tulheliwenetii TaxID=3383036 RepID=A0ACC2YZW8_9PEZI|nr:hypothetical protein H2199_005650 [Cladosporium sp. JES 115]
MAPKATYFSAADDALLIDLKETKKLSWKDIKSHFPNRTKGTLQVRYCRTLQHDRKERTAAFAHAKKPDVTNGTAQMKAAYRITKTVSPPTNRDHLKRAVKNKIKFDQLLSDADTITDAGAAKKKFVKVSEVEETGFKLLDIPTEADEAQKKASIAEDTTPKKITDKNGNTGVITRSGAGAPKAVVISEPSTILKPKVTTAKVTKKKTKAKAAKAAKATKAAPITTTKANTSPIPSNTPLTDAALMALLEPPAHHTAQDPLLVTPRMGRTLRDRLTKAERLANAAGNAVFSLDGTTSHPRKEEARRVAAATRRALISNTQTKNGPNPANSPAVIPAMFINPPLYMVIEYNVVSDSHRVRRRLLSEYDTPMDALRGLAALAQDEAAAVARVARMVSPAEEGVVKTTVLVAGEAPSPTPEPLTPFVVEGM